VVGALPQARGVNMLNTRRIMKVLETSRLVLRQLAPEDAAFIHELVNDHDWLLYIGDRNVRTLDDARAYIESGPMDMVKRLGFGLHCVELKESGTPIGICGLIKRDALPDVDLGYALLSRFRGQGYAAEAACAVLQQAVTQFGFGRVLAIVSPENERSIQVLTRLGFKLEGRRKFWDNAPEVALFARDA
jgi:RimJ/RimL family protein N-acetyltransferase